MTDPATLPSVATSTPETPRPLGAPAAAAPPVVAAATAASGTAPPLASLPLEQLVLARLHAVRPLIEGPIPAPVDELQRAAMAAGTVEWQPRSRADRRM